MHLGRGGRHYERRWGAPRTVCDDLAALLSALTLRANQAEKATVKLQGIARRREARKELHRRREAAGYNQAALSMQVRANILPRPTSLYHTLPSNLCGGGEITLLQKIVFMMFNNLVNIMTINPLTPPTPPTSRHLAALLLKKNHESKHKNRK